MNKIIPKPYTIYVMIGPSGCGKTYFINSVLQTTSHPNVEIIGSDSIRRELLHSSDMNKYDNEMMYASEQAFHLLRAKLIAVTSYPINIPFVIIDSTGLWKDFRDEILRIAKENNYSVEAVVFTYKDREDYFKYLPEDENRKFIISKHIKRLNREVMKDLNHRDYREIYKIKRKDFTEWEISFNQDDVDFISSYYLQKDSNKYVIIGDVHGCLDELKELILKNGFQIEGNVIQDSEDREVILIGDVVDKGPKVKETIEFIYQNILAGRIKLVKGNHENFIYKYMMGKVLSEPDADTMKYFNSIELMKNDEEVWTKFRYLYCASREFFIAKDFVVTHAPCRNKQIGKLDQKSLKEQRNIIYPKRKDFDKIEDYIENVEKFLGFLNKESRNNLPFHIFGHIPLAKMLKIRNKVCIDTGCVDGGQLTSIVITGMGRFYVKQVESKIKSEKKLVKLFEFKRRNVSIDDLERKEKSRIKWLAKNKVNFISGTMCPADKDENENTLEDMKDVLNYYRSKDVKQVMLQPKHMGSRCNVYINTELDKCFAVSRNGYVIDHVDLSKVFKEIHDRFAPDMEAESIDTMIIDGELMPWAALGTGLIEGHYKVAEAGIGTELEWLDNCGFEDQLKALKSKCEASGFMEDHSKLNKKELSKKYGHHMYSTYKNLLSVQKELNSLQNLREWFTCFKKQIALYGKTGGEFYCEPFALLKVIYKDGSEKMFFDETNEYVYKAVTCRDYRIVNLDDENALEQANDFYYKVTDDEDMEGIVIKPNDKVFIPGVAPFRKIRNDRYLTIVYGYNYLSEVKHAKLMKQKRIRGKLRASVEEFMIGKQMLEIPRGKISMENEKYVNLCIQMIQEEKREKVLDPRL